MKTPDYEILKFKGPQEHQPATIAHFLEASQRMEKSEEINGEIKNTFKIIADIISDTSENLLAQKMKKKRKKIKDHQDGNICEGRGKYLSKSDKEGLTLMFNDGIEDFLV